MTKKKTKSIEEKMAASMFAGKIAIEALASISDKIDDVNSSIKSIMESAFDKKLEVAQKKSIFRVKTANQWIEEAMNKPVTMNEVNKCCDTEKTKAKYHFAACHKGSKTRAAHAEGFDDGWQAALKVFSNLNPDFLKWTMEITLADNEEHSKVQD